MLNYFRVRNTVNYLSNSYLKNFDKENIFFTLENSDWNLPSLWPFNKRRKNNKLNFSVVKFRSCSILLTLWSRENASYFLRISSYHKKKELYNFFKILKTEWKLLLYKQEKGLMMHVSGLISPERNPGKFK